MIFHASMVFVVGILSGILSYYFKISIVIGTLDQQISVLGTLAQVSVSMMGFMLAALAILASISDKPLLKNMANMGHFKDLLLSLFTASAVYMLTFLIAGSVLVFGEYGLHWRDLIFGSLCANIIATLQIGWKFWKVLSNLNISH